MKRLGNKLAQKQEKSCLAVNEVLDEDIIEFKQLRLSRH